MKLELVKDQTPDGWRTAGWKLIAENEEERLQLGSIRNLEFWGDESSKPVYDGYTSYPEDDNYVQAVHFASPEYKRKRDKKLFNKE